MFEQAFRNIDDALRKEAGCTTELDYTEQTSWLLFLKYLDGLEEDKAVEAKLEGKKYRYILDKPYRWDSWAAPKNKDGMRDHNKALVSDDLTDFVDDSLFPYLQKFTQKATGPDTIEYKIGQIFGEIKNKIQSGHNLREIIDHIDELRFRSQTEKHELSHLYEAKIKNMGNAGRNGGEYCTPRPLIRAIIKTVKPELVLAYVAYTLPPVTRETRAAQARPAITTHFNFKQQAFLDFVLAQYVRVGVDELAQEKLSPLLKLKYNNAIADAIADLGAPEEIGVIFSGFQQFLYNPQAVEIDGR